MIGYLVVEAICFGLSKECLCHAHINIRLLSNIIENFASILLLSNIVENFASILLLSNIVENLSSILML